jgi:ketosteroid isomerase-like protein
VDEDAVLAANEDFYRAFNGKDLAAMDALWARDGLITCIHPGWNVLIGRELVMESWARILENPDQPRVFSGAAAVARFADVAIVTCREIVAGSALAATNVFVREEPSWKLVHHQSGPVAVGG